MTVDTQSLGNTELSMSNAHQYCSKVAIIIINFKNLHDTSHCVNSLLQNCKNRNNPLQIIVIDNCSTDNSFVELKSISPEIKVLASERNLGFAGANNLGVACALESGADYVFLLNNDAFVDNDTIERLVEVFNKDPTVGIVGATILDYCNPKIIDNMGAKIDYLTGRSTFIANGELYRENRDDIDVDYTCGAAMMIKRGVIEKVGFLPEYYFLYSEEKDYCVRAKKKGYRVVVAAKAKVIHKGSSTVKRYVGLKNYYFHRNRLIFLRIHAKPYQFIFAILHSMLLILPFYSFTYLVRERISRRDSLSELSSLVSGVLDSIRFKTGYTKKVN